MSDYIRTPDRGVDASLTIALPLSGSRTPGIVNRGTTIYQFKWRTDRKTIFKAVRGELKKLKDDKNLPDAYVLVTNVDVPVPEHDEIRNQLRAGCEDFPPERIVIVGAGELADYVNDDPRVRLVHFSVYVGLCTLEVARAAAERRYRHDSPPALFGREEETAAVRRFLADPTQRVLIVHGPQGVGKTRIVAEALACTPERVVWARERPPQPVGLMQVLDEAPHPAVLVVDEADLGTDQLLRKALESARLKVVLIGLDRVEGPDVVTLSVAPFDASASESVLERLFPKMSSGHRRWLFDQFGGLPGLLLLAGAALQAAEGTAPLPEAEYDRILEAYEARMTGGLTRASSALNAFAVLPRFRLPSGAQSDLEAVCGALGLDIAQVVGELDLLEKRTLVVELADVVHDGSFEVVPPLLARRIARRVMRGLGYQLRALYERLSAEGRAGLVRRVAEIHDEAAVRPFLRWLFSEEGIFASIETVAVQAASIRALASGMPRQTSVWLRRVVEGTRPEDRARLLVGEARREIIWALTALLHRRDTFEDAARSLLAIAEVEEGGRGWDVRATSVFAKSFHWKHPYVPKDGGLRGRLLASLGKTRSARRRQVVAKAAKACLTPSFTVAGWQSEGVTPPEPGWRATVWSEAQAAIRPVVGLLRELVVDPDPGVRKEAIHALAGGVDGVLKVGLVQEVIDSLEFLAGLPLDGTQRAYVVRRLAHVLKRLEEKAERAEGDDWQAELKTSTERGRTLLSRLTSADFRFRLFHWLGPTPIGARRRSGDDAGHEDIVEQGKRLVDDVLADPAALTDELLDWLTDVHAENRGQFLFPLGERDRGGRWLAALEQRIERPSGVEALALYLRGWLAVARVDAERHLDAAIPKDGRWAEAVVGALWATELSQANVERLLRCVREGGAARAGVARRLGWGRWGLALDPDSCVELVTGLRDGTREVDWALLDFVHDRWRDRPAEGHHSLIRQLPGPVLRFHGTCD